MVYDTEAQRLRGNQTVGKQHGGAEILRKLVYDTEAPRGNDSEAPRIYGTEARNTPVAP